VPTSDPYCSGYADVDALPLLLRQEIEQFFTIYKDLEPGRFVRINGWGSRGDALREITKPATDTATR
jgi:inorganic pyrophosphatase